MIVALAMLNFIRKDDIKEQLFSQFSSENVQVEHDIDVEEDLGANTCTFDIKDRIEIDAKRNSIADAIWRDTSSLSLLTLVLYHAACFYLINLMGCDDGCIELCTCMML